MTWRVAIVVAQTAVAALLVAAGACDGQQRSALVDSASTAQTPSDAAAGAPSPSSSVTPFERTTVSVDSVLLRQDLDGSGHPDHLVRQKRKKQLADQSEIVDRRLALYLDARPSDSVSPAWAIDWDDVSAGALDRNLSVAGGSLLVFTVAHADADESIVLHVLRGDVRELLRQQIDNGEGSFSIGKRRGRIVVVATGPVRIDGRIVTPGGRCTAKQWAGSSLVFDAGNRGFEPERSVCVPRR